MRVIAVILVSLPLYVVRFTIAGIPTTLFEVILLIGLGIIFFQSVRAKRLRLEWIHAWALLLIAIGAASLLIAPDTRAALGLLKAYIIEPALFGAAVVATVHTKSDVLFLLKALTIPAVAISIITLVQYATGWGIPHPWTDWPGRRATAIYPNPNAIGLFLAPLASAFIATAVHWTLPLKHRNLFIITAILSVAAILAARSDGAVVAVAASTLLTLLWTRWKWLALTAAAVILTVAIAVPQSRTVLTFQDTSGQVRIALWQGTARLLHDRPLTGSGLASFPRAYDQYRNAAHTELMQYPHNILLNFWTELGLAGAIWIVGTFVVLFATIARMPSRTLRHTLTAAVIATLVYGLVDVPYFKNDLAVLFWLWLSCAFAAYTKSIR